LLVVPNARRANLGCHTCQFCAVFLLPFADHEPFFRQNSHFLWAFGVNIPDCYGSINVDDGTSTLFVPRLPASFAIWMGKIKTAEEFVTDYGVTATKFTDELAATLEAASPSKLLLLSGKNSDSGATFPPAAFEGKDKFDAAGTVDTETLFPVFVECRVFKTEREMAVMRHVIGAASDGHCVMMRGVRAGLREDGLEALFRFWMQSNVGARYQAYTYICGSGDNAATLHYGHAGAPNDRIIGADELVLCDCGNELMGYISDITTSFPSTGKFTADQRVVYSAVLGESVWGGHCARRAVVDM
jgi:Xaa-Pro dipeptidase